MSSKPNKSPQNDETQASQDASLGYSSSLKLGLYYFFFFSIITAGLFGICYYVLSQNLYGAELRAVRNKAQEYRAWFLNGDLDQLEQRMAEQSVQGDEVLFVHINGKGIDYVNFTTDRSSGLPIDELHDFDSLIEGTQIPLGQHEWTIASVPVGRDDLILQAGKNSSGPEETLSRFRKVFLFLFIPGSLISLLTGSFLTFRFLAPIRHLIGTMRGILKSGDFSQRARSDRKDNELNALTDLFNRLLNRNERLIEGMHDSLDHVAHDFRTPLNRINITAQRALNPGSSPTEIREALADCAEETDYLERLLTVLMNVAEAQSGAMQLKKEEISVRSLFEDVTELYELVAEDKEIDLKITCPDGLTLHADHTRLAQALANLVDNAIKYSDPKTSVELGASVENNQLTINVQDQGQGIAEADLPHIWKRLFRADPSRTLPGMGLGLSLVKAIIETHGGQITVTSKLGEGTRFTIWLPLE